MRPAILQLEESKIREVANAGMGRSDVLAFWFGESDEVTPEAVRQAAIDSIAQGETFYAHNLGLPELRQALADYTTGLHRPVGPERIAVTSGGVNALMLAVQTLVEPGDEVVAVTPVWPNLLAQPAIMGGVVKTVSLKPVAQGPEQGAWRLDLPELLAAITPATRLLIVNAPNNPTGWTLTREEQQQILAHCRRTGRQGRRALERGGQACVSGPGSRIIIGSQSFFAPTPIRAGSARKRRHQAHLSVFEHELSRNSRQVSEIL